MSGMISTILGTFSVAVDTNFHLEANFQVRYKGVDFVYHCGDKDNADFTVSCILINVEKTYFLIEKFISILSFALDKLFFICESSGDGYRENLLNGKPGCAATRMMRYNIETSAFLAGFPVIRSLPLIDTNEKSNFAKLYRMARSLACIYPISSFLFYFHIFGRFNACII